MDKEEEVERVRKSLQLSVLDFSSLKDTFLFKKLMPSVVLDFQ